jgi:hypothetical protein
MSSLRRQQQASSFLSSSTPHSALRRYPMIRITPFLLLRPRRVLSSLSCKHRAWGIEHRVKDKKTACCLLRAASCLLFFQSAIRNPQSAILYVISRKGAFAEEFLESFQVLPCQTALRRNCRNDFLVCQPADAAGNEIPMFTLQNVFPVGQIPTQKSRM